MKKLVIIALLSTFLSACAAQPPAEHKLPKLQSSKPLFFKVIFGDNATHGTLVTIDESKGDNKGYDIAYIDQNRDGDLTNDKPLNLLVKLPGMRPLPCNPMLMTGPSPTDPAKTVQYGVTLWDRPSSKAIKMAQLEYWIMNDHQGWEIRFLCSGNHLYPTASQAIDKPLRLGTRISTTVTAVPGKKGTLKLSAATNDAIGNQLLEASYKHIPRAPSITILDKQGKVLLKDKKFAFG